MSKQDAATQLREDYETVRDEIRRGVRTGADALIDAADYPELDLVEPRYACPCCGERREDYLEWQEDDTVKCATCGTVYDPNEE